MGLFDYLNKKTTAFTKQNNELYEQFSREDTDHVAYRCGVGTFAGKMAACKVLKERISSMSDDSIKSLGRSFSNKGYGAACNVLSSELKRRHGG
jgi:hypothetical protein